MASGLDDLAEFLAASHRRGFEPKPYYEPETDSLIFYARDEKSYGHRINQFLTLFLATGDNTLVGCEVKGISRLLKAARELNVLVADTRIKLLILIRLALVPDPEEPTELDELCEGLEEAAKGIDFDPKELCFA